MKTLLIISTFILSSWAQAHEACGEPHFPEINDLTVLKREVQWFASNENEVNRAHCLRKEPFSIQEMKDWMIENDSPTYFDQNVNGIDFKEESSENLEAFKHLTTYMSGGQPNLTRTKKLSSSCKKVDCAMKELFGEKLGTQLLFMQRRFGMNGSNLVQSFSDPWKTEELDVVLLALNDYPEGILPFQETRTLTHAPRDFEAKELANSSITIFNSWNKEKTTDKRTTIFHEIAHALGGVTSVDQSEAWFKKGGWAGPSRIVDGALVPIVPTTKPRTMVSNYGAKNEKEDFAESIVAYRYSPNHLKEKSPEKYEFLKEVIFDNVEYTSKENCENPKRLSDSINLKIANELESWEPSEAEITNITKQCTLLAFQEIKDNGYAYANLKGNRVQECYSKGINALTTNKAYDSLKGTPNYDYLKPMFRNSPPKLSREKSLAVKHKIFKSHMDTLDKIFVKAFKDPYFCNPAHKNSVDARFSESDLGFSPSRNRELFQDSWHDLACSSLRTSSPEWTASRFVRGW